jgi:uncharacterized membrane protein SpoIIM required for sporulation
MLTSFFTALLFAAGAGVWIYTKLQQRTGYGNSTSAVQGAAVSALLIFIVVFVTAMFLGLGS